MAIKSIKDARKVEQDDLRVGDKVYVVNNEPEVVENVKLIDGRFETDLDYHRSENVTIYLAERVRPEIPTKKGSVIKVTSPNGVTSANWFLRRDGKWYSQDSATKNAEEFARFMELGNFDLEVLA